jgi:hypothetical protein
MTTGQTGSSQNSMTVPCGTSLTMELGNGQSMVVRCGDSAPKGGSFEEPTGVRVMVKAPSGMQERLSRLVTEEIVEVHPEEWTRRAEIIVPSRGRLNLAEPVVSELLAMDVEVEIRVE